MTLSSGRVVASSVAVYLAACIALAGCQSHPIPLQVIPNSTFVLPLQAPAYGSALLNALQRPDYQRGDLVVVLCPTSSECNPATNPPPNPCPAVRPNPPTEGYYLTTRYVTSVMPHPASDAGIRGFVWGANLAASSGLVGQDLAFLDVPAIACPGTYRLFIRRRPVGAQPGSSAEVTTSWGATIQVLDVPGGSLNPLTATNVDYDMNIDADLADLVPNPTVPVRLQNVGGTFTSTYPAAAKIDVTYPDTVEILGAYQYKQLGIKSLVSWRLTAPHVVTVSVVDPQRCTEDLRIVYRLKPPNTTPLANPLTAFSASAQAQRLYDLNGALLTSNSYVVANPVDTSVRCGS